MCREEDFLPRRGEWGCDGPTDEAWGEIECHTCVDEPRKLYRQHCRTCDGDEVLPLRECPNRMVGAYEQAILRYATLLEKHVWPFAVPAGDCPASLVDAIVFVVAAKARIEDETLERERAKLRR